MTSHYPITRAAKRHPQVLYPDQLGERVDLRPNLFDQLGAESFQREIHYRREARKAKWLGRFGFANRAGRQSPNQSSLFLRFARPSTIAWGDVLFGAACGLLAGMLGTVGLASIVVLFL
jgi:hypothetical protein